MKIKPACPHCLCSKVVKNGRRKNGCQVYHCKECKKQYQDQYTYIGSDPNVKELIKRMLVRGSDIRDIAYVLRVSAGCIQRTLLSEPNLQLVPRLEYYEQVQVDELYSFVGNKRKKVWILYAFCQQTNEILAVTMGKRNRKTVKELYKRLQSIQIDYWCTDHWEAFKTVFPPQKHKVGKNFTKAIEGVNTYLRGACKRLIRRTTAFSIKLNNHWAAIKLVMFHRNLQKSFI